MTRFCKGNPMRAKRSPDVQQPQTADSDGQNPERNWFGFTRVSPEEKTGKVLGVFDSVATRYDVMNDAMSMGIHRLWKNRLIREIRPKSHQRFLDVAGGTGDIAFRIKNAAPDADITVCDINRNMLEVGRDRALDRGFGTSIDWVTGNAESLPFPSATATDGFDVYTIAFGLRNVTHIDKALRDAARVLKPGGRFYCLEFSHVENPLLARGYDAYSRTLIPLMGQVIAGDSSSYQYLIESIRQFPTRTNLRDRLLAAGFSKAGFTSLTHSVVCIHSAIR